MCAPLARGPSGPGHPERSTQAAAAWLPLAMVLLGALLLAACGSSSSGTSSTTASSTVTLSTVIPPNGTCPTGGYSIDYGIDDNGNGTLDPGEVEGTATLCNGGDGFPALVKLTDEGPSENCTFGGTRVEAGLDDGRNSATGARDGILQPNEVLVTNYLCAWGTGVSETGGELFLLTPHHGKVSAGGTSTYFFKTKARLTYRIRLSATDSDLKWTLYTDSGYSTNPLPCDEFTGVNVDESCATGLLEPNTPYYLSVTEQSNIPNLFDVTVQDNAEVLLLDTDAAVYRVDPHTWETPQVYLPNGIDPVYTLYDLRFTVTDPATGRLYGLAYDGSQCEQTANYCFYRIDPYTGDVQDIPLLKRIDQTTTEPFADAGNLVAVAVDPVSGTAYASVEGDGMNLYTMDLEKGELTYVDYVGVSTGSAMTFDGSGNLYLVDTWGDVSIIDTVFANAYSLGTLSFLGAVYEGTPNLVSLVTRPEDGHLIGSSDYPLLVDVDLCTVTAIGTATPSSYGIPFLATMTLAQPKYPPPCVKLEYVDYQEIDLSVFFYPAADQLNLYWSDSPGIDPANPATYRGRVADLDSQFDSGSWRYYPYVSYLAYSTTYYMVVTAQIGDVEVPSREVAVTTDPLP